MNIGSCFTKGVAGCAAARFIVTQGNFRMIECLKMPQNYSLAGCCTSLNKIEVPIRNSGKPCLRNVDSLAASELPETITLDEQIYTVQSCI